MLAFQVFLLMLMANGASDIHFLPCGAARFSFSSQKVEKH